VSRHRTIVALALLLAAGCAGCKEGGEGGGDDPDASGGGLADGGSDYPAPRDDLVPTVGTAGSLDIATWNIENFPRTPDTPRIMADLITSLDLDLVGVVEIASVEAFDELVARLPEHSGILSSHTYGDGTYQKVGFIYRSDLMTVDGGALLFGNQGFDFPRPPMQVHVAVDDGVHPPVEFLAIILHLKAGLDSADRDRRRAAMITLEGHLREVVDAGDEDELIVMGDFNEELETDTNRAVWAPFLDAPADYTVRTDAISDGSTYTYVPTQRFYDHFITTAGLADEMSPANPVVIHLDQQLSSYLDGVSDHVPVAVSMTILQ
jgi:endonuclease/exonuclease/phosphatase family metal-dependent hydrolase